MGDKCEQILKTLQKVEEEKLGEIDAAYKSESDWLQDAVKSILEKVKLIPKESSHRRQDAVQRGDQALPPKKGRGKRPAPAALETVFEDEEDDAEQGTTQAAEDHDGGQVLPSVKEEEEAEIIEEAPKRRGRQTRAKARAELIAIDLNAPPARATRSRVAAKTATLSESFPSPPKVRKPRAKKAKAAPPAKPEPETAVLAESTKIDSPIVNEDEPTLRDHDERTENMPSQATGSECQRDEKDERPQHLPSKSPVDAAIVTNHTRQPSLDTATGDHQGSEVLDEKVSSDPNLAEQHENSDRDSFRSIDDSVGVVQVDREDEGMTPEPDLSSMAVQQVSEPPQDQDLDRRNFDHIESVHINEASEVKNHPKAVVELADGPTPVTRAQSQQKKTAAKSKPKPSARKNVAVESSNDAGPSNAYLQQNTLFDSYLATPTVQIDSHKNLGNLRVDAVQQSVNPLDTDTAQLIYSKQASENTLLQTEDKNQTQTQIFASRDNVKSSRTEDDQAISDVPQRSAKLDEKHSICPETTEKGLPQIDHRESHTSRADSDVDHELLTDSKSPRAVSQNGAQISAHITLDKEEILPQSIQHLSDVEDRASDADNELSDDDEDDGDDDSEELRDSIATHQKKSQSQTRETSSVENQNADASAVQDKALASEKKAKSSHTGTMTSAKLHQGPNLVTAHRTLLPVKNQPHSNLAATKKATEVEAWKAAEANKRKEAAREAARVQKQKDALTKQKAERAKHAQQVKANQEEAIRKAAEEARKREEAARKKEEDAAARRRAREEAERREKEEKARRFEEAKLKKKQADLRKQEEASSKQKREAEMRQQTREPLRESNEQKRPKVAEFFSKAAASLMAPLKSTSKNSRPASTSANPLIAAQRPRSQEMSAVSALSNVVDENKQPFALMAPVPDGIESIEIAPYRSEGETSEEDEDQEIPMWAQGGNLRRQIVAQQKLDPDELFQQHEKSCPLNEVFDKTLAKEPWRDLTRRTSTGNWMQDRVTWKEEMNYKKAMGYL